MGQQGTRKMCFDLWINSNNPAFYAIKNLYFSLKDKKFF